MNEPKGKTKSFKSNENLEYKNKLLKMRFALANITVAEKLGYVSIFSIFT